MTIEEAIRRIKKHNEIHSRKEHNAVYITEALNMAVKALEENQKLLSENKELKRLLRSAVEDFEIFRCFMSHNGNKNFCDTALEYHANPYDLCFNCPLSGSARCEWQHADEALKLIGGEENA